MSRKLWLQIKVRAWQYIAESGGNISKALELISRDMHGAITTKNAVEVLILIFVAIVVIYQLIPQIGTYNTTLQASANSSSMAKFAGGLGEWLFPLLGIVAIVFLLFRRGKGVD